MQHKFSRHIKLLICVTLYNEDQETLGKTLLGICEVRSQLAAGGRGGGQGAGPVGSGVRARPARLAASLATLQAHPPSHPLPCLPLPPLLPRPMQNLEVLYRQYGRDGNKHGLDWQEVAVAIIQDGMAVCDPSVAAASTVTVRRTAVTPPALPRC